MLGFIIAIIAIILLIGFLGGSVVIKHDNKETDLNDKINHEIDKVKDSLTKDDKEK